MTRLEEETDAVITLMQIFNGYGSFLIHSSETTVGDFSLSVRDTEHVQHYKRETKLIWMADFASPEKSHLI